MGYIPQREFAVRLPVGYTDSADQVHRQAIIRKMRGHEEALLSDQTLNVGQLVTELLRSCLIRLDDLDEVTGDLVSSLYTADRNYLLLELRRITLGDRLTASYSCPHCGSNVSVVQNLAGIPVRQLEEDESLSNVTVQLEDGYVDREGVLHTDVVLTLPRGADEEFVSSMAEKDLLLAQDALLLRCIKRFGSLPKSALEAYGVKILRDLTLGDRQRIFQAFNDQLPGADFRVVVHCEKCGADFETLIDITHFFALS